MPPPHPPEFRQRAVELACQGDTPVAKIAKALEISESCLRNWLHADTPDGNSGSEREELAELRRRNWLLEQENEILRRAQGSGVFRDCPLLS